MHTKDSMSSTSEIKFSVEPEFCDVDWDLEERLILNDLSLKYLLGVAAKIDGVACEHEVTDSTNRMILSGPKADLDVFKGSISSSQRVTLSFLIPNRLRGIVIGSRGRLLKETSRRHLVEISVRRLQWDPFGDRFGKFRKPPRYIAVPTFPNDNDAFFKYPQRASVIVEGTLQKCLNAKHDIIDNIKKAIEKVEIMLDFPYELKRWSKSVTEPVMLKYPDIKFRLCSSEEGGFLLFTKKKIMIEIVASFQLQLKELQGNIGICLVPVPRALHELMPQYLNSYPDIEFHYPPFVEHSDYEESGIKLAGDPSQIRQASEYLLRFSTKFELYEVDLVDLYSHDILVLKAVARFFGRHPWKYRQYDNVLVLLPSLKHLCDIHSPSVPLKIVKSKGPEVKRTIKEILQKFESLLKEEIHIVTGLCVYQVYQALQNHKRGIEYSSLSRWGILFGWNNEKCFASDSDEEDPSIDQDHTRLHSAIKKINECKAQMGDNDDHIITISPADQAAMFNSDGLLMPAILKSLPGSFVNRVAESEDEFSIFVDNGNIAPVKQLLENFQKEVQDVRSEGFFKTTFEVPSQLITALIQYRCLRCRDIKKRFGVGLQIHDSGKATRSRTKILDETSKTRVTISGVRMLVMKAREYLIAKVDCLKKERVKRTKLACTWQCRAPGFNFLSFSELEKEHSVKIRLYCEAMKGIWPHPSHEDEITIQGPSEAFEKVEQDIDKLVQFEADNVDYMTYEVPFFAIKRAMFELEPWYKSKFEGYGVEYRWVDEYDGRSTGTYKLEASGFKDRLDKMRDELDYQIGQEALNYSAISAITKVPSVLQPEIDTLYLKEVLKDTEPGDESNMLEELGEDLLLSEGEELAVKEVIDWLEAWTKETAKSDRELGIEYI